MPSEEKRPKSFSLFSVVTFANSECQTQMADMVGLCLTAEECDSRTGGSKSGNCASGFGVCCLTVISDATATPTITTNTTYIQNPNFPSADGTATPAAASTATYMFNGGTGIKQIRLDFQTLDLQQPTAATGICQTDIVTITAAGTTNTGLPLLCGTSSGQHVYVEHGTTTASQIAIALNAANANSNGRTWKILVRFIEDGSASAAPTGCGQYFTGVSGTISSFNLVNGNNVGSLLGNSAYSACIRPEAGMKCFAYSQARPSTSTPDAFNLAVAAMTADAEGMVGAACVAESVTIGSQRYCGGALTTDATNTEGTVIHSTSNTVLVTVDSANRIAAGATSFEIRYVQKSSCP